MKQLEFPFVRFIDAELDYERKYIWPIILDCLRDCVKQENHYGKQLELFH